MQSGSLTFQGHRWDACGLSVARMVARPLLYFCNNQPLSSHALRFQGWSDRCLRLRSPRHREIGDATPRLGANLYWLRIECNREVAPLPNESGAAWDRARVFASPHKAAYTPRGRTMLYVKFWTTSDMALTDPADDLSTNAAELS